MSSAVSQESFSAPEFLQRLRAGDSAALNTVVKAYLDQIFRAARGAGLNRERAEDVTQATFLTFVQTIARFEGRSHVRTWLFGILYKKIAEARRGIQREENTGDIDQTMEQRFDLGGHWTRPPQEADIPLEQAEIRAHIEACLEETPTRQRMAFLLREVEGLSSEEICKALGVTLTNLGVLFFRVRNRLRECLEKRGVKR